MAVQSLKTKTGRSWHPTNRRFSLYSVSQFSHSVMSNSLRPHGLQHARPPCPSPTLRACSNSCPSSQWWHPAISSSSFSRLQSFPASGSFPMSQFFSLGGQSIGAHGSAQLKSNLKQKKTKYFFSRINRTIWLKGYGNPILIEKVFSLLIRNQTTVLVGLVYHSKTPQIRWLTW